MSVEVFSIGFGKALCEKTIANTKYRLSALPLGGYVKLKGQDDLNPSKEVFEKDSYSSLSPLKKIYILLAGPLFNIILAFLLYMLIGFLGYQKFAPIIGQIAPNSAAAQVKLQSGDEIVAVNGVRVKSFDEISKFLHMDTNSLYIKRQDKEFEVKIVPQSVEGYDEFMQKTMKPVLGIYSSQTRVMIYHLGFENLSYAFKQSVEASTLIIKGLIKLVVGDIEAKNLGGVLSIVDFTSKASQSSFILLLTITALISINLGILNLLPIPMLDGGHILFNLYELIFRKKVPLKVFEYLSYGGMALLLSLMIFATYNDIVRFANLH